MPHCKLSCVLFLGGLIVFGCVVFVDVVGWGVSVWVFKGAGQVFLYFIYFFFYLLFNECM